MFTKGGTAGPGRPKGALSGRNKALAVLDDMLADAECLEALRADMKKLFMANPTSFFNKIVVPLLPKQATASMGEGGELLLRFETMPEPVTMLPLGSSDTDPTSGSTACIEAPPDSE